MGRHVFSCRSLLLSIIVLNDNSNSIDNVAIFTFVV